MTSNSELSRRSFLSAFTAPFAVGAAKALSCPEGATRDIITNGWSQRPLVREFNWNDIRPLLKKSSYGRFEGFDYGSTKGSVGNSAQDPGAFIQGRFFDDVISTYVKIPSTSPHRARTQNDDVLALPVKAEILSRRIGGEFASLFATPIDIYHDVTLAYVRQQTVELPEGDSITVLEHFVHSGVALRGNDSVHYVVVGGDNPLIVARNDYASSKESTGIEARLPNGWKSMAGIDKLNLDYFEGGHSVFEPLASRCDVPGRSYSSKEDFRDYAAAILHVLNKQSLELLNSKL